MILHPFIFLMALRDMLWLLPIIPSNDPILALEVAIADRDDCATRIYLHDGRRLVVHEPELCEGQFCAVHNPSDHPLKDAPYNWREGYLMERICEHGVGHPDPDHLAYLRSRGLHERAAFQGVHGCDGCCFKKRQ